MLILFISLFFVGGGTIMYTYNQYEKGQIDILSEKLQSVLVEIEHKLSQYQDINEVSSDYVNSLLVKFSNVFYSDINLYDVQGNLVGTSRKEIFDRNLTGKKINAEAYRELVLNKKARIVHKESIGKMEYYSAYIPFLNAENELLAYLNLPYFSKEIVLRKELLRVVVGVINIYAFLLVLSIIVAVYISNRLTEPLRMVQQRIKNVDLSKKNERIDYQGQDEIGELVVEYNRMLDELDKSAKMLAKSERESAWREMARQIAHEIKNPLTPMKLSIQLLNKSWQNKDEDFEQRFQRSTQTLIEQIDSLSSIATAFSQFARMPIARSEKVNLIERINRSAELFKECSYATLDMHLPEDEEVFVRADNERMLQVFNNLVKNAIQAIPKDKNGKVIINLTQSDANVVVEINDNGVGVKPEMKDQLFQPNFTTKSSGTGLGLAIVKNIIEEFGGAIWFKSELGKGSSFFVSMPVFRNRDNEV
jgi:signal transduction histidine kinase